MGPDAATKTAAWPDGPWRVDPDDQPHMEWSNHVIDVNGNRVCFMAHSGFSKQTKYDAAAHLIASAPDLYAALKNMRNRFHACCVAGGSDPEFADAACAQADVAIAAAEGSAP